MVERERPEPQHGERPDAGQNPDQGANRAAQRPAPDGETERAEHGKDAAAWGNLPDYFGSAKQRGSLPEVSEKYRKLYEAYLRAQSKATEPGQAGGNR